MNISINEAGLNLIKYFEGLRLVAYQDIARVWTIGYGHTSGVTPDMIITADQAEQYLIQDTAIATDYVRQAAFIYDGNQLAAMVSLCYNIGRGNFRTSSVLKYHKAKEYQQAADAFLLWDKAHIDGELIVSPGLLARRHAERALYLTA